MSNEFVEWFISVTVTIIIAGNLFLCSQYVFGGMAPNPFADWR